MAGVDVRPFRFAPLLESVIWIALLLAVGATPLIVDVAGRDVFRLPKTAFFQASMIAIGGIVAGSALVVDACAQAVLRHRMAILFASAAVSWVAVVSMTAVVPAASHSAPFSIFCHAILFVVTVGMARNRGLGPALAALFVPAIVNATMIHLQAFGIWQPFNTVQGGRLGNIGLIGNPNTAGTYLLIPTIAAITLAAGVRRHRLVGVAIALLLLSAIFHVQTITVVIGLAAGLTATMFRSTNRARIATLAIIVTGMLALATHVPTRERVASLIVAAERGEYARLTSWRIPAAATAMQMFRDRPVLGVGPGGFAARYMPHRLHVEERNPHWILDVRESFGEAHNDHAQVMAETGLPGYVLFVLFLVSVARRTFQARTDDERTRFVQSFAFPAVAAFAAVALGQFPLEMTAASSTAVFAAGLCFAWSRDAFA